MRPELYDIAYDDTSHDLAFEGGDLAPWLTSYDDILTELVLDAFESRFNSSPYVLPNWGFEGRDLNVSDETDDSPKLLVKRYVSEILKTLGALIIPGTAYASFEFLDNNVFTVEIEATLADMVATTYDVKFQWSGVTKLATVI